MQPTTSSKAAPAKSRKPAAPALDPLAALAREALEDVKGQDILMLDVRPLTTVTDTMIICTGTSNRHVKSLAQNVAEEAKKAGYPALGIEGLEQGEWVLVDLGGVVVHVMQAQARVFYQLEKLWTVEEPAAAETAAPKRARKTPTTKAKVAKAPKKAAKKAAGKASTKPSAARKAPAKSGAAPRKTAARKKSV